MTKEQFIEKARKIHGDKYDYSKVEYINANTKVCIICPEHGEFWQTPSKHTNAKHKCPQCCLNGVQLTQEQFIEKARQVHGDKYDYSKVEYINSRTKICVICHKKSKNGTEHGEFWITPNNLLRRHGCPSCKKSFLELKVENFLNNYNLKYEAQKTFDWLYNKSNQFLDFYLPDYNIAIECQGIQHYVKCNFGDKHITEQELEKRLLNIWHLDKTKKRLCEEHGIKILYYTTVSEDIATYGIRDLKQLLNKIYESKNEK